MSRAWVDHLDDEDLAFIRRFVVASGSLKGVASSYGVSYPTVRARLDRLIAKVESIGSGEGGSALERAMRKRAAEGRLDPKLLPELLSAYERDVASLRNGSVRGDGSASVGSGGGGSGGGGDGTG